MKLLNLDELLVVNREIRLFGKSYAVAQHTVGHMLEALKLSTQLEKDRDQDPAKVFEAMVSTACQLIPDCPREQILKLTFDQISALIEFATAPESDVLSGSEAKGESEKGGETEGKS